MEKGHILAASAGICGSIGAISGKLAFDSDSQQITRVFSIGTFILSNILMWAAYTRSLALSECTSTPMVINMAANFAVTGLLGNVFFSESHSPIWWFFLSVLIFGLTLMLTPSEEKNGKKQ